MRQALLLGLITLAFLLPASAGAETAATDPSASIVAAPQPSSAAEEAPAIDGCRDLSWLDDGSEPPPGTECCSDTLNPDGCSGACFIEMSCPDARYVACYGSHTWSCYQDGSYINCDGNYYSCEQCQHDAPLARGCEYC